MRFLTIAVGSVVLFFPLFWLFDAIVGPSWSAGIAAFAMYIAFPVLALKLWGSPKTKTLPSMESALAAGELLSVEYVVSAAVEVQESEDEGKHFYLAVGSDETLFLSGQYLCEPVERGAFPNTRILVHSHKILNFSYGVACLGEPLSDVQHYPPFTGQQFQQGSGPEDRQTFAGALSEVTKREV